MFLLEELIAKTCFEQLINNNEFSINLNEIVVLFDDKSFQEFDSWQNLIHELCVRSFSKIYFKFLFSFFHCLFYNFNIFILI